MIALYLPPVQQALKRVVTTYASSATGMDVQVRRIDLRFPLNLLVLDVVVKQQADTLCAVGELNVKVAFWPLLKGTVVADRVSVQKAQIHMADWIESVRINAYIDNLLLKSKGIDLSKEYAQISQIYLQGADVQLVLNDTLPKDTTVSPPPSWVVDVQKMQLKEVAFGMQMVSDTSQIKSRIERGLVSKAHLDLAKEFYGLDKLTITNGAFALLADSLPAKSGFDASHIEVSGIQVEIDSLQMQGRQMHALLRELSGKERCGLEVMSLRTRLLSDGRTIRLPYVDLATPYSYLSGSAVCGWQLLDSLTQSTDSLLMAQLDATIDRNDVMLCLGDSAAALQQKLSIKPMRAQIKLRGNAHTLKLHPSFVEVPGALSLQSEGTVLQWRDSLLRNGSVQLHIKTEKLADWLAYKQQKPSFTLPDGLQMEGRLSVNGAKYHANLGLKEGVGKVQLMAGADIREQTYRLKLKVDSLQLHRFLPQDSVYNLSFAAEIQGKNWELKKPYSLRNQFQLDLGELVYKDYRFTGFALKGKMEQGVVRVNASGGNQMLSFIAEGNYAPFRSYPDGELQMYISQIDLQKLGILTQAPPKPVTANVFANIHKDQVLAQVYSDDLELYLNAFSGLNPLQKEVNAFVETLNKQIKNKVLNHAELRRKLPVALFSFKAGKNNLLAYYLKEKEVQFDHTEVDISTAPNIGIETRAFVHALRVDTLLLDTVFFEVDQDTTQMMVKAGVVNGPKNPQLSFAATLSGHVRSKDAEWMAEYLNDKGEKGILLGVNIRPITVNNGKEEGVLFKLIPEEPIVAYQPFKIIGNNNWVYLHRNMRVYANIDMHSRSDMQFKAHSVKEDTTSLQNINVEVRKIPLDALSKALPYFPALSGFLSAEAHYIQTPQELQVSTEAFFDQFAYEKYPIGNMSLGATWLPGAQKQQYFNGYVAHEGEEVMNLNGKLYPTPSKKDSLNIAAEFMEFPLRIANAFLPRELIDLSGTTTGHFQITGLTDKPWINGELAMDSAYMSSTKYAARFKVDRRPIQVVQNRLKFDKLSVFTTGENPFVIDGYIDFKNLQRPLLNLRMEAENYLLVDAKRRKESLVYGKVVADLNARIRGPLDALVMRGSMHLLGNTDVAYIYTDSPLAVQDRLGNLVTFTSFKDTVEVQNKVPLLSLGGLDMNMRIHIDPAVRFKIDLDAEGKDRVELEGGGDLTMKYSPQGTINLTGRYTLTGGLMKYSLPVVSLKEFVIQNGSYVDWVGDPMKPTLNFKATDRIRASVSDGDNGGSRMVNFDVSVVVKERLDHVSFAFDVAAPDDAIIQSQLAAMDAEERGKQALYIMIAKTYLGTHGGGGGNTLNMGSALNSVLSSQINSLLGNLKDASFSFGIEEYDNMGVGKRTDYSFRYSQRFFNNRFRLIVGGKVSTGNNVQNSAQSFIDNFSLEYRLDQSGTSYLRVFYDKNYENLLEGEIIEAGAGVLFRKKLNKLTDFFILRRKKNKKTIETP